MDQKITDTKYRIFRLVTDTHLHGRTIFFRDHTVQCQRQCHPLIFLDASIIMGIQHGKTGILVERILFDIHTRGVNVRAQNIHTVFQVFFSDDKHRKPFSHVIDVNPVACLQCLSCLYGIRQIQKSCFFGARDKFRHALTLCFAFRDKFAVSFRKLIYLCHILFGIIFPCQFSFHNFLKPRFFLFYSSLSLSLFIFACTRRYNSCAALYPIFFCLWLTAAVSQITARFRPGRIGRE